jgi:adiponectin receptor
MAYARHHFSFHVLSNHSQSMHRFGNELDHLGVVFVTLGSAIPSTHFGFRCEPHLRLTHWTLVSTGWVVFRVSAFADGAFAKVSPGFALIISFSDNGIRYGFCYLYSSSQIPVTDISSYSVLYVYVLGLSTSYPSCMEYAPMASGLQRIACLGEAIYGARIPERWYPKRFDIWGNSHQIVHVLVVLGAIS